MLKLVYKDNVSMARPISLLRKRSMLVMNSFQCRPMPAIKSQLGKTYTDLVIIPGGMTHLLQPLDVTVNKPMKDVFRVKWNP